MFNRGIANVSKKGGLNKKGVEKNRVGLGCDLKRNYGT